jgi:hypothetical protein
MPASIFSNCALVVAASRADLFICAMAALSFVASFLHGGLVECDVALSASSMMYNVPF